ncbi:MAG: hypothetical protein HYV26_01575 [Candidatus Hydrogenedentes bacterium]|nr:hypothetical protein [Candidatus Hydrogenedentota bacterium]
MRQPMPAFDTLNVTLAWHDFQDYRLWTIAQMFGAMDKTVRRYDDRPLIMYYGGSLHHSAHQLSVYNVGLGLLKKYGGVLDVTCFEDPVPAEIGSGIVRSYGVPLMCEAWQIPPPLRDHRRLFFQAFALGAKSYQLVGDWANMEMPVAEFQRTAEVFKEMAAAEPLRAPVAGLISYRTIMSFIPARNYINPTLALVPKLQEHQYSLDWRSDMGPLNLEGYPALLDANSEVLAGEVIEQLGNYVEQGGRLALLVRSGRYALEDGRPEYPLLTRLQCPNPNSTEVETWTLGQGQVLRVGQDQDWSTDAGLQTLLRLMDFLQVQRPISATPGVLAALSRGAGDILYATVFNPVDVAQETTLSIASGILPSGKEYHCSDLFTPETAPTSTISGSLESGFPISLSPYQLCVLKLTPK